MTEDHKQLDRTAQRLLVEVKRGYNSPPEYESQWQSIHEAIVERVVTRAGGRYSEAAVWFPALRWQQSYDISWGDRLRVRTYYGDAARDPAGVTIFSGFVTAYNSSFHGGDDRGSGYERCSVTCRDHRWLTDQMTIIYGQAVRGPDDYTNYGTDSQSAVSDSYIFASGQRCIFNASGRPNRDPTYLSYTDASGSAKSTPIFIPPDDADAEWWTVKQMLHYILAMTEGRVKRYFAYDDVDDIDVLDHSDWDTILSGVSIEGLSVIEAIDYLCRQIGWSFREDYDSDGQASLTFYKVNSHSGYSRSDSAPTIRHQLHAPAVGETISAAVAAGKKMLWSAEIAEDIASVVNNPYGLGSPRRFEFTAELVPAWLDSDLVPDSTDSYADLFYYEWQLQENPDRLDTDYFKYYHAEGSSFKRNVGRKWALNESGLYSAGSFDRGTPFNFAEYIEPQFIYDSDGKRAFAPFRRQLLPALTYDSDNINSIGIIVEFSVDGGSNWYRIPASIRSLTSEAGIYIDEPNLADIYSPDWGSISGGDLDSKDLNFFTSLADDKTNSRTFKTGGWNTRVRVTASVQLDQRLVEHQRPTPSSGSPLWHTQIYDYSDRYEFSRRTMYSKFYDGDLPAWNIDQAGTLLTALDKIRQANEDMSISGRYTLERLWIGETAGQETFKVGDAVEKITGRDYVLNTAYGAAQVYPEIIEIIYDCQNQKQNLLTRDLRFTTLPIE